MLFQLAPMAELSHRALRELILEFGGCDEYFTEMISAGALIANGPFEKWYIDAGPCPEKVVFQVVGSDPDQISRAAAILDGFPCAGIDINMGCSAPKIRKSGCGAAWMASIDKAGGLIARVRPLVRHRLSVKLRIGFNDDFDYLARFCTRLQAEGADLVILHPRLVTEKFKRLARWDYVHRLKRELSIPVAGNGDISSAQDLAGRAKSDVDAVMAGRAAVRQPWIFAQARQILENPADVTVEPMSVNIEETGLRFLELVSCYQPPEFHLSRAIRFFGFFCDNLKWGNYLKNRLGRQDTLSGIEGTWKEYFKDIRE